MVALTPSWRKIFATSLARCNDNAASRFAPPAVGCAYPVAVIVIARPNFFRFKPNSLRVARFLPLTSEEPIPKNTFTESVPFSGTLVGEGDGVGVGVAVLVGEGDGVGVGVFVGEGDGVGVGVGLTAAGSIV